MRRVCQRNESSVLPAADARGQRTGSRTNVRVAARTCSHLCVLCCAVRMSACCDQPGVHRPEDLCISATCFLLSQSPSSATYVATCVAMYCNMRCNVLQHVLQFVLQHVSTCPTPRGASCPSRPVRPNSAGRRTCAYPRAVAQRVPRGLARVAHRGTRAGSEQQRTTAVVQRGRSIVRTAPDRRTLSMKSSPSSPSPRCPKHETCAHHKQRAWIQWIQHPVRIMPSQLQQYA